MIPVATLSLILAGTANVQNTAAAPAQKNATVTLEGCIAASPTTRGAFTLDEEGQMYLLKGVSVREFAGKRVEVTGATAKRLRIVGGLYPSPNIAAQPDDPTKAAIAAQNGPTSQSGKPLIEFTVKSVRIAPGRCPEPQR